VIVVDASMLTGLLLGQSETIEGVQRELAGREHQPLHAPELIEPDALNAHRRLTRAGRVEPHRAQRAVADLAAVRLVRYPHPPLRARVWQLRDELTAYDATYLALAEALGGAVLLTADRALATVARRALGARRVGRLA
jgi:predicted nucleic acid-binding protein